MPTLALKTLFALLVPGIVVYYFNFGTFSGGFTNYKTTTAPDTLVIKGNNIWIRDQPATGKVVMKLNDGTVCQLVDNSTRYFEIIRGSADYWYNISYQGQSGWVFGSQTSRAANLTSITATSPGEIWNEFKAFHRQKVEEMNQEPTDYMIGEIQFIEGDHEAEFVVDMAYEWQDRRTFSFAQGSYDDFFTIQLKNWVAGATAATHDYNFVGFKTHDGYQLYPEMGQYFEGQIKDVVRLGNHEYLVHTMTDTGIPAALCATYHTVIYINTEEPTFRRKVVHLGYAMAFSHRFKEFSNFNEDEHYTAVPKIDFLKKDLQFVETRFVGTYNEDESDFLPTDTVKTVYTWNNRTKAFNVR